MSEDGIKEAATMLQNKETADNAVVVAIKQVEDYPYYKSVGYGGLPNEEMVVELDAAFMDGDTLNIGAVMAIKDYANPVMIAKKLSNENMNNILVGSGAEKYAHKEGFERKNMLTDRAKKHYENRILEENKKLNPYDGHDTVGMVCLDDNQKMTVATSTSGLFMKKAGRVGDSPISGSGFYVDSEIGGASATGLGEDLMKGCISYEIVSLMKRGYKPQLACEIAVKNLEQQLIKRKGTAGDISVVAMNNTGEYGAASTIDEFSFVVATNDIEPTVFIVQNQDGKTFHVKASQEWIDNYNQSRTAKI